MPESIKGRLTQLRYARMVRIIPPRSEFMDRATVAFRPSNERITLVGEAHV
jgi:hypothetical protein